MLHPNDKQNRRKHGKMLRRLQRGVLLHAAGERNTGKPETSHLHPHCKWAKRYRAQMGGW